MHRQLLKGCTQCQISDLDVSNSDIDKYEVTKINSLTSKKCVCYLAQKDTFPYIMSPIKALIHGEHGIPDNIAFVKDRYQSNSEFLVYIVTSQKNLVSNA